MTCPYLGLLVIRFSKCCDISLADVTPLVARHSCLRNMDSTKMPWRPLFVTVVLSWGTFGQPVGAAEPPVILVQPDPRFVATFFNYRTDPFELSWVGNPRLREIQIEAILRGSAGTSMA